MEWNKCAWCNKLIEGMPFRLRVYIPLPDEPPKTQVGLAKDFNLCSQLCKEMKDKETWVAIWGKDDRP